MSGGEHTLNGILRSGCATSGSTCKTGFTSVRKRSLPPDDMAALSLHQARAEKRRERRSGCRAWLADERGCTRRQAARQHEQTQRGRESRRSCADLESLCLAMWTQACVAWKGSKRSFLAGDDNHRQCPKRHDMHDFFVLEHVHVWCLERWEEPSGASHLLCVLAHRRLSEAGERGWSGL